MIDVKYIYFEELTLVNKEKLTNKIQNEDILFLKPNTNSSGFWSFRIIEHNMILDKYWIDLERFNKIILNDDLRIKVHSVMKMINDKINID